MNPDVRDETLHDETLRDGTRVRLRPIRPDDRARLQEGLARLSSRSRYYRFLGAISTLSEKTLRYLTEIDQVNHLAWIAVDPTVPGEPGLGVARCVRVAGEPTVAEVAVVVADDHQDRGLGSLLLERLATEAARRGIETFRASVLRENAVVVHALQEVGATGHLDDGLLEVELPVETVRERAACERRRGVLESPRRGTMGVDGCPNHPGVAITKRCAVCQGNFCGECVVATDAGARCAGCRGAAGPVGVTPGGFEPPAPKKTSLAVVLIIVAVVCVFLVVPAVAIVAAIAIPNLISAKKHGNEASAIGALKTISTSQALFREGDKEEDNNLDYGMLSELGRTNLIDPILASGTKQGYLFQAGYSPTTSEFLWWAQATPAVPGTTGDRVFYTNQAGVIFYVPALQGATPPKMDPKTCEVPPGARPVGR